MGSGRGKRGGIRVICYLVGQDEIFMLYAYPKNRESDLSPRHLQILLRPLAPGVAWRVGPLPPARSAEASLRRVKAAVPHLPRGGFAR